MNVFYSDDAGEARRASLLTNLTVDIPGYYIQESPERFREIFFAPRDPGSSAGLRERRQYHFRRQAVLITLLAFTGFEIHGSFVFFGYDKAVQYHETAAWLFLGLIAFAIFWHLTTGQWRQYIPTPAFLRAQIRYYITGIFRQEAHPTRKNALNKLNPLQKMAYLGLKILVIPVQATSGLFYLYYKELDLAGWMPFEISTIAFVHTLGTFLLMAFIIGHVYMTTTGHTPLANIRAMITGWEDLEIPHGDIARESHSAMIRDSQLGYYFLDQDGFIREVNDSWLKLYGYGDKGEVLGKHCSITREESQLEELEESLGLILAGKDVPAHEVTRVNKDGSHGRHVLTCHAVFLDDEIIGMAGFILDRPGPEAVS